MTDKPTDKADEIVGHSENLSRFFSGTDAARYAFFSYGVASLRQTACPISVGRTVIHM